MTTIYYNNFFAGMNFNDALDSLENDYGKKVLVLNDNQKTEYHIAPGCECAITESHLSNHYLAIISYNGTVLRSVLKSW